jgi:hypothetical protein
VKTRPHYRRLLLFILVLTLPSILIVWVGWRNARLDRDKRLNDARAAALDAQQRARKEIGRDAWEFLQNLRSQETGFAATSNPAVRLVACWRMPRRR